VQTGNTGVFPDIRIRRHEVAGVVAVYELTRRRIDLRLLQEGLARTPDGSSPMSMYTRSKSLIGICLVESLANRFLAVLFAVNEGGERSGVAHLATALAAAELALERSEASAAAEFRDPARRRIVGAEVCGSN
jgi:hypothetical protein